MERADRSGKDIRIWITAVVLAGFAATVLAGCASGAPRPEGTDAALQQPYRHPCHQERPDDEPLVDETQNLLEETACRSALWLDGLFGDHGHIESARRANGYVETSASYSQFEGFESRTRLRVRVDLPNLEERLSAFFGRDDEDDFIRDRSEGFAIRSQFPRLDTRDNWLAGLGYALPGAERLQTDIKVGAAGLRSPRVFVRARLHYNAYADALNLLYLRVTPFWTSREGVGVTGAVDYNRLLDPVLLLRLSNIGTVSEATEGMDWLSAVILYQNLRKERAIAYELFVRGDTGAPEPLYEYGARTVYRHPLLPHKLYGELILGYSWPRTDPEATRHGSYEIGFGLELPFGQKTQDY